MPPPVLYRRQDWFIQTDDSTQGIHRGGQDRGPQRRVKTTSVSAIRTRPLLSDRRESILIVDAHLNSGPCDWSYAPGLESKAKPRLETSLDETCMGHDKQYPCPVNEAEAVTILAVRRLFGGLLKVWGTWPKPHDDDNLDTHNRMPSGDAFRATIIK